MDDARSEAIAEVKRTLRNSDPILAFDLASQHLNAFPDEEALKHQAVLALARAGAIDRAAQHFSEWKLDTSKNPDVLALEGRLLKDRALKLTGAARRKGLLDSAAAYRRVYDRKPSYYPAINWASLTFLGGKRSEGAKIAARVLADPEIIGASDYWSIATRAEANLLVGKVDQARSDLKAARKLGDEGDRASTRRQLRLILSEAGHKTGDIEKLLSPLAPRPTVHYFADESVRDWSRFKTERAVAEAKAAIAAALKTLDPGALFGSLGSPAEILVAEAALSDGRELDVILPLPPPIFRALVVARAGKDWAARFDACAAKARRFDTVAEDPDSDDLALSDHAACVAMGLTLQRAQNLDGKAVQMVLSDAAGEEAASPVRVAWVNDKARRSVVVKLAPDPEKSRRKKAAASPRPCSAVIFGDLPGFSKMPEKFLPIFWETVMGTIGDVVAEKGEAVALRNTWGDAIHLVVPDVRTAADLCLAVQKRLSSIDGSVLGRKEAPTMRIGAHYGPVFADWDPIVRQDTYYGRALSRAARIEPITPPGAVYVTEAFAAILLLETTGEFACNYVGQVPLAKGYGTFRMYEMREA